MKAKNQRWAHILALWEESARTFLVKFLNSNLFSQEPIFLIVIKRKTHLDRKIILFLANKGLL